MMFSIQNDVEDGDIGIFLLQKSGEFKLKVKLPISVVTTSYNNENEISQFLDDICTQSCDVDEIVISDGGSEDDTVKKIVEYSNKSIIPIRLSYGYRLNIAQGFNAAIKTAKNQHICILGIGNRFPYDFIQQLYSSFLMENVDVICPLIKGIDSNGFAYFYNKLYLNNNKGLSGCGAPNHGCIARKEMFEKLGFFYEGFFYAGEDAEFYRYAKSKGYKVILDRSVSLYWSTPTSFYEQRKQVRLYAIAENQWASFGYIVKRNLKTTIDIMLFLTGILLALLLNEYLLGLLLVCTSFTRLISWLIRYGLYGCMINCIRYYYKSICQIWFSKYLTSGYRVRRVEVAEKVDYE